MYKQNLIFEKFTRYNFRKRKIYSFSNLVKFRFRFYKIRREKMLLKYRRFIIIKDFDLKKNKYKGRLVSKEYKRIFRKKKKKKKKANITM